MITTRLAGHGRRWGAARIRRGFLLGASAGAALLAGVSAPRADEISDLRAEVKQLREEVAVLRSVVKQSAEEVQQMSDKPKVPPKMVSSGNESVSLAVSGHVNRLLLYADDGDQAQVFNADNKVSTTRLNVTGKAKIDDDFTAGATIEVELRSNDSGAVVMSQETEQSANVGLTERKAEVFLDSKALGKLSVGQGAQAADGITEIDLSNTNVISSSSIGSDVGGSLAFRRKNSAVSSGQTVSAILSNFDQGRLDRVRYDTPDLWGFVGSASYADNDIYDAALRYGGKFSGYEVAAGIGYTDRTTQVLANSFNQINASAAVKAPFGTSLQGAFAMRDFETRGRDAADFWWIKLGQEFPALLSFGATAFSIDFAHSQDQALNGTDGHWVSFAAVQQIKKASTELYFSLGDYDADIPNIQTDDILFATLGARVKF